jgi:hypothetical protein
MIHFLVEMSVNTFNIFFFESTHLLSKLLVSFKEQSVLFVSDIIGLLCAASPVQNKNTFYNGSAVVDSEDPTI